MSDPRALDLEDVAERAATRLAMGRFAKALDKSATPLFVLAAAAGLAARTWGPGLWPGYPGLDAQSALVAAGALIALWLVVGLIYAFAGRPSGLQALARWDEKAGRHELFTSAYSFVREGASGPAVELHLRRAADALPAARQALPRELPYYVSNPSWLAPALFLLFVGTGALQAPPVAAQTGDGLSEAERERAAAAGDQLEQRAKDLDPQQLTQEEKEKLADIKAQLKKTAKKLKDPQEKATPREVLEELERRAREAEKLAQKMGAENREKISGGLLAELERHADTAELAGALRGNEFGEAAAEARRLGEKLAAPDLGLEAHQRIQEAFAKGLAAATQQDKLTQLGKRLVVAHARLAEKKAPEAGAELVALADLYQKLAERLKAQKQLKQLAKQLRELGQETLGKQQQGLKQLAQAPPSEDDGAHRLTTDRDLGDAELPPLEEGQPPPPSSDDPLQDLVPLDEPLPPGQAPVPGEGGPPPVPGQGQPWPGGPPVPGGQGGRPAGRAAGQPGGPPGSG
ncbi:MAG: hypothetical protein AB7T09_37585, partial [Planctomycetota bacterium]